MNDSTLVRVALRSDATTLAAVRAAADPTSEFPDPRHFENLVDQNAGLVYVAQSRGSVIGYLVLQRAAHAAVAARNPIHLWQLYVAPDFHGSGVAAQLMDAAFNHARNQTHDVIWLGVSEHNARGLAFYRKHGFKAAGHHLVGSAGHTHNDVVMWCALE
jgi:ribosomal protein S18 acetylase RimI-like enzyme